MSIPAGCVIESLDASACRELVAWIRGERSTAAPGLVWLLAHSDDGVTWGRRSASGWRTGAAAFPEVSPPITVTTLLELRLFGEREEILVWRSRDGLRGRRLSEAPDPPDEALRPKNESRVLLGDRLLVPSRDGFSRVGSPTGAEQVVPLTLDRQTFEGGRWPLRLHVRHYFEEQSDTGAVRIAATRLVDIDIDVEGRGGR